MLFRIVTAVVMCFAIYRVGVWAIRVFGNAPPEPPPPGEMRKIKVQYRCSLCGAEARMTLAQSENPDPPRHCMEEMDLVPTDD